MSLKFNSEHVVCPVKYFQTDCFLFQVESFCFSKQQNKLVLTLNSFKNGAIFGNSLEVIEASGVHIWVAHWPNAENRRLSLFASPPLPAASISVALAPMFSEPKSKKYLQRAESLYTNFTPGIFPEVSRLEQASEEKEESFAS